MQGRFQLAYQCAGGEAEMILWAHAGTIAANAQVPLTPWEELPCLQGRRRIARRTWNSRGR